MPSWQDTTVAYIKSVGGTQIAYVMCAIVFGPWLIGRVTVNWLPALGVKMWRWLRTQVDSA
jgi:hypothetical protein